MKDGIFEMSMRDYLFAHGMSSSGLKRFAQSPAHYKQYIDHPEEPTRDQKVGTILHYAVFEPDLFAGSHYVKPLDYVNKKNEKKKWRANATECDEWLKAHTDRLVISKDELDSITGMRNSIYRHPAAKLALSAGKSEMSCFCEDMETGLQLKARLDRHNGNALIDLKKCQDASKQGFPRTIANFGYDLQSAVHLQVAQQIGLPVEYFCFIAVEENPPYAVGVYQLNETSLSAARGKVRRLMSQYASCSALDEWPAYSNNIEYIDLPGWALTTEMRALMDEASPGMPALLIE